jgi:hypothetical protein
MLINVTIEQTQPLTGSASTGGERSVSFVGWLELLRAIAELAEATGQSGDQSREADEPPATQTRDETSLS